MRRLRDRSCVLWVGSGVWHTDGLDVDVDGVYVDTDDDDTSTTVV